MDKVTLNQFLYAMHPLMQPLLSISSANPDGVYVSADFCLSILCKTRDAKTTVATFLSFKLFLTEKTRSLFNQMLNTFSVTLRL